MRSERRAPARPGRCTRRGRAGLAAAVTVLTGACGGDGASVEGTAGSSPGTTAPAAATVLDGTAPDGDGGIGDFTVTVQGTEIWMTLPDGVDEADVCSPAEPAVTVITLPALEGVQAADVTLRKGNGTTTTVELQVDDDGAWQGIIGPFTATRQANDHTLDMKVVAHRLDGSTLSATTSIAVRAPERCGTGVTDRRDRATRSPELRLRTEPADGAIAARTAADCSGLPATVRLAANAGGGALAVEAALTLPNGTTIGRALSPAGAGTEAWQTTFGIDAWASMPSTSSVPATVTAVTARGAVVTATTTITVHRPVPCDDGDGTGAGGVRLTLAGTDVDATAAGACPTRPTTVTVDLAASADTAAAEVRTRTPSGTLTSWPVSRVGDRRWTATIGPIDATGTMPDINTLTVEAKAVFEDGTDATTTATLTVHRPPPCPTTTPATTVGPPQVDATVTPGDVDATAANACPARPTTFTVKARTTGQVTAVTAKLQFSNGQSQTLTLTHQGGGQWAAAGGPLAGSGTMPDASTVTVTVRADGPGGTATDTTSFTLHRPASC